MNKKTFFARAASKALALAAAVMMMSAATACSKDSDNDNGGGTPPLPEPKAQTVTIDGVEKPILKAEYEDGGDGDYRLFLNLSADGKERVEIGLNKELHMTGSPIDLTEREKKHEGDEWYWAVDYYKPDNIQLIDTYAHPDSERPVFTTGTLTISGSFDGTLNIRLENGRVKGTDGKEHTLVLSYSGKMTKKK